jgi:polysaccharide export outer membrane protein
MSVKPIISILLCAVVASGLVEAAPATVASPNSGSRLYGYEQAPEVAPSSARSASDKSRPSGYYVGPAGDDIYQIGAGDVLEIEVFGVPDLARVARVNARGMIKYPLVGVFKAQGMTSEQVEQHITASLDTSYLEGPQVSVFVKEYASQYTLEGHIRRPGVYALQGQTTLLQAIAQAGGLEDLAERDSIVIFRRLPEGKYDEMTFDYDKIRHGESEDVALQSSDVVVIDKSLLKAARNQLLRMVSFGTISP